MDDKNIHVSISSGTIIKVILFGVLCVLVYTLRDLVLLLLTAVVIASSVEPATRFMSRYRIPRVISVIAIYASIIILLSGIVYLFIPPLFNEISNLTTTLPDYIESINGPVATKQTTLVRTTPEVNSLSASQDIVNGISKTFSIKESIESIKQAIAGFTGGLFDTVTNIFGGVFSFGLVVVISFYLSVQENGIENFLRIISPIRHEKYIIDLWKRSQAKIGKWMQGQLLLGLLIGILVYLGLTILGIKYALVLAMLAVIAELIPLFGPIIAAVPAILLGFSESPTLGLMVVGFYIIIQQFENHLIYPLVVRKVIGVHPLVVILSLIIGGKIAGFLGVLLAVPIAAVIMEFADDIQREKERLSVPNA